ncbi:MAG: hypothetical protein JNL19_15735 [Burkholderiales bacterium]|nr:hypothetical protein [Burkholderiales bacterium]
MSTPVTATPTTASAKPVRPFYWSVRRELWEHRSLYLAPTVVAALLLLAMIFGGFKLPPMVAMFDTMAPTKQRELAVAPYAIVAIVLVATAVVVALFYCLDALYGERRDRSVLFWKSMPISDRTAVLAKVAVPMLVVPVFLFALITATQLAVLVVHVGLWAVKGLSVGNLLQRLPWIDMPLGLAHLVSTLAVWYAPIYAWLLLVSAWAQRSPLAWAVVPWIAVTAIEQLMFRSSHVAKWLHHRFTGGFDAAFSTREPLADVAQTLQQQSAADSRVAEYVPDVARFLGNADVWIGIAIALALITVTIWLRRRQESQSG